MIYNEYITDEDNWKEENIDEKASPVPLQARPFVFAATDLLSVLVR